MTPHIDATVHSILTRAEWTPARRGRAAAEAIREHVEAHPVCPMVWWNIPEDDDLHRCRHDAAHPGRHVCACRSWRAA